MALQRKFKKQAAAAVLAISTLAMSFPAAADNHTSAKYDYVTDCISGSCGQTRGSIWSSKPENTNGVAVSVRMGTQPVATDDKVKSVLTYGLKKYGVNNIKFFFEQNNIRATGIAFHVRGGTEGLYVINKELKNIVEKIAARANNTSPALASNIYSPQEIN